MRFFNLLPKIVVAFVSISNFPKKKTIFEFQFHIIYNNEQKCCIIPKHFHHSFKHDAK